MNAVMALFTLEGALIVGSLAILFWQVWRYVRREKSLGSRRVIIFRFRGSKLILRAHLIVWRVLGQKRKTKPHHIPWIRVLSTHHLSKARPLHRRAR